MKSRQFFLLFCMCAVVPLVAAKLSLALGWFSNTGTNKGVWMEKEIQLLPDSVMSAEEGVDNTNVHWRLVYVQAEQCDQSCEQALLTLQQLYSGLGRKQLKIKPLILAAQIPAQQNPVKQPTQLKKFPDVSWQSGLVPVPELQHHIVIVNQRGLVLLRYPATGTPEQMRDLAKHIRTDLLHLINYDRSGA